MRRVIEELIARRQEKAGETDRLLAGIAAELERPFLSRRRRRELGAKVSRLAGLLGEWMTVQDREWDAYAGNHATSVFKSLQWKIEKLEAEYSHLRTLLSTFATLERDLDRLVDKVQTAAGRPDVEALKEAAARVSPHQYADFEARFRGTPEQIRRRLAAYLPTFAGSDDILDLGCGRGEFLELLREQGKRARGIDLSDSMLAEASARGVTAQKADALAYLRSLPDASLGGLFSAQVIEHLEPEVLTRLIGEAWRVLRPGAPIVLNTVNPLSLFALSQIYLLDPTHRAPVHPEYLRHLLERSGFSGVTVEYAAELTAERLEEAPSDRPLAREFNGNVDRLNRILFAPAEYAAIGHKP